MLSPYFLPTHRAYPCHIPGPHTPSVTASNLWQMELTRLGSRSITLSNDDEPTIATNTRCEPPQPGTHEPEEPSPVGESVHAEQVAAPLTVPKITSVHIKPGRGIDMPSAA